METSEDIVRYSVLHDNNHLFMSKYLTYLPTKEQLRDEIERQKSIFYMHHPTLEGKNDNSDSCEGGCLRLSIRAHHERILLRCLWRL